MGEAGSFNNGGWHRESTLLPLAGLFIILMSMFARGIHAQTSTAAFRPAASSIDSTRGEVPVRQRLPDWLRIEASYRLRYERLTNTFLAGVRGDDILVHRVLALAEVHLNPFLFAAELQDARAFGYEGPFLNTSFVNAAELLQAYAGLRLDNALASGDELTVRVGRLTMDIGSRRLVSRNRYRNTINAFTGLEVHWRNPDNVRVAGFFTAPVQPRPTGEGLRDNKAAFDDDNFSVLFWGLYGERGGLPWNSRGETFLFGLHETDDPALATRNRRLITAGMRWIRPGNPGNLDFEIEATLQAGQSHLSLSATDTMDLDHSAYYLHTAIGYTIPTAWSPRLVVQYDVASGDLDPTDLRNNRFDTLFGDRRFEFGPTGIYGLLSMSNIVSPGVRLEINPSAELDSFMGYRAVWLAARRDALPTRSIHDDTGASGRFVGHQIEGRVRAGFLVNHLNLEAGVAYFVAGNFLKEAGEIAGDQNTFYYYIQTTLGF